MPRPHTLGAVTETVIPDAAAIDVARTLGDELVGQGAKAVWLAGSHARGEAGRHSDIDLGALAAADAGPGYRLERREGYLISTAWTTVEATRASFDDPSVCGAAVPGWRRALVLHDPDGIAAELVAEAHAWDWPRVDERARSWTAEQVTGYAEELHKVVGALERGDRWAAAMQRSVLSLRLPLLMSVQRRILYDSENDVYRLVAEAMGEPWASTHATALATDGEAGTASTAAALELYMLAAAEVGPGLDARQSEVVAHAVRIGEAARASL